MTETCADCGASPVFIRPTHLAGLCASCARQVNTIGTPANPPAAPKTIELTETP